MGRASTLASTRRVVLSTWQLITEQIGFVVGSCSSQTLQDLSEEGYMGACTLNRGSAVEGHIRMQEKEKTSYAPTLPQMQELQI